MSRTIPHVAYKYIKDTHVYVGTYTCVFEAKRGSEEADETEEL